MTACAAVSGEGKKPEATAPGATEPDTTEPDVTQPDTTEPEVTNPTTPDVKDPEEETELIYDMANHQWFSDIFEEKTVEEWNALGQYTLRLEGLHTPVILNMDGTSVLSVTAFDQTIDLGGAGMASDYFDGYSPVNYIRSTKDAVVIRINGGEMWDDFILITKEDYFRYPNEHDGHIALWVNEDGTLGYRQTYLFMDDIEEMGSHVLYQLTSRDQVLHNEGHAGIINGEVVFTAEKTVVFSDHFDADAMFSESKAAGEFTEYETLDELFEANKENV
jgi:hypothetical protein